MSFCNTGFSKKKQNGEIEKQSSLCSENANISTLPMTEIMAEKFNITGVLFYNSLYLCIITTACWRF